METCAVMVVPCPERAEEILLAGGHALPAVSGEETLIDLLERELGAHLIGG